MPAGQPTKKPHKSIPAQDTETYKYSPKPLKKERKAQKHKKEQTPKAWKYAVKS